MLFGILCTSLVILAFVVAQRWESDGLRDDMQDLKRQVNTMSTAQDAVAGDIAAIKTGIANWNAAAAANLEAKLAEAKAAWEADDEAQWQATHAELSDLAKTFATSAPVTPPATSADPSPAPVASPAG